MNGAYGSRERRRVVLRESDNCSATRSRIEWDLRDERGQFFRRDSAYCYAWRMSKTIALFAAAVIVLTTWFGCTKDGKPTEFGKLVGNIVDCTTPGARDLISEFGPVLEQLIASSTGADGQVDWQRIKDATKSFAVEAGGCVLASAVQALQGSALKTPPGALRGVPVDPEVLRRGFEEIRASQLAGKRFKTESGEL